MSLLNSISSLINPNEDVYYSTMKRILWNAIGTPTVKGTTINGLIASNYLANHIERKLSHRYKNEFEWRWTFRDLCKKFELTTARKKMFGIDNQFLMDHEEILVKEASDRIKCFINWIRGTSNEETGLIFFSEYTGSGKSTLLRSLSDALIELNPDFMITNKVFNKSTFKEKRFGKGYVYKNSIVLYDDIPMLQGRAHKFSMEQTIIEKTIKHPDRIPSIMAMNAGVMIAAIVERKVRWQSIISLNNDFAINGREPNNLIELWKTAILTAPLSYNGECYHLNSSDSTLYFNRSVD